jgi:uncharacterized protein (UPF0548 family)
VIRLGRPSADELARVLAEQSTAELTYPEVGATSGTLPVGYQHDSYERVLGRGDGVFEAACDGLRDWACHDGAGLTRTPPRPELRAGVTIVQGLPIGPALALAAVRIVSVVGEPDRFVAYGTLPMHPEAGEEAFVVERDAEGVVRLVITVFSKPRHPLARLGWFVGRRIQITTTHRFLDGLERYVAARAAR